MVKHILIWYVFRGYYKSFCAWYLSTIMVCYWWDLIIPLVTNTSQFCSILNSKAQMYPTFFQEVQHQFYYVIVIYNNWYIILGNFHTIINNNWFDVNGYSQVSWSFTSFQPLIPNKLPQSAHSHHNCGSIYGKAHKSALLLF